MAVLVEAISVVVRRDAIDRVLPNGWDDFAALAPNSTLCTDEELARIGFMTPTDAKGFIAKLEALGFKFVVGGEAIDVMVVDQQRGPMARNAWLETGHVEVAAGKRVAAARLAGSELRVIASPDGWRFEESLSANFGFVETERAAERLVFLRREGGNDVFLDRETGKEVYIGRTESGPAVDDSAADR
jgi:hypothetical protein